MKKTHRLLLAGVATPALVVGSGLALGAFFTSEYHASESETLPLPTLNKEDYNARLLALAHFVSPTTPLTASTTATSTAPQPVSTATTSASVEGRAWPVPTSYPRAGALLPFNRIVAYYGNFFSTRMGVLGEYAPEVVLQKLASTTEHWAEADPSTPVVPAIQYIAVVAQASAGKEGKYILRMPDAEIEKALGMANSLRGILILDVQVGQSTLEHELPLLDKYLVLPNVHLAIDPEFSMKFGHAPGRVIGTFDAADINFASAHLAGLVRAHQLPPKILVIHRFTSPMVTNYRSIHTLPEVQLVIDMDGFGSKALKYGTYQHVVTKEPVQFAGIKLFYKNDTRPPADGLLSPEEAFALMPSPIYVQYQ